MATSDVQILAKGTQAAPLNYRLADNVELLLKMVSATFTDASASGDWLPCVTLISDSGDVLGRAVDQGVKVTAGNDAEVSWFPGVKPAAAAAAGGGIQFNTDPQTGGWLAIQTTGQESFGVTGFEVDSEQGFNFNSGSGRFNVSADLASAITIVQTLGIEAKDIDITADSTTIRLNSPDVVRLDCARIFLDGSTDIELNSPAVYATNLPTSDPGVSTQLWNDLGTLKVSP